jgi:hypothetical protein
MGYANILTLALMRDFPRRRQELSRTQAHTLQEDNYAKVFHDRQDELVWERPSALPRLRQPLEALLQRY